MLARLWSYRGLLRSWSARQFQLRYRQSAVGVLWVFVTPFATLGAGALVFRRIAGIDTGGTPYILSTMSAVVPWTFLSSSVNAGVTSIINTQAIISRLAFPRATLPLSMVVVALFDLSVSALIYIVIAFATGAGIPATAAWVPILLLIEFILVSGIVLLASAVNMFLRDVKVAVPLLVQMWLLITPVMYPLSAAPKELRSWILINPMAGLVETFRSVLTKGQQPDVTLLIPALIGAFSMFLIGAWYFSVTEHRFADVI